MHVEIPWMDLRQEIKHYKFKDFVIVRNIDRKFFYKSTL